MKYFTIDELTRSSTAERLNIDNTPSEVVAENLIMLVENVLDPLRERYGKPIMVNSGYRSAELNRAVGGAKTSQHRFGKAADITTGTKEGNIKLFAILLAMGIEYDQLIDENYYSWIHVSYNRGNNRKQVLHL